jgi:hypothetical protein
MAPGEYAVHYSSFAPDSIPSCAVFSNLSDAEIYAQQQIQLQPDLRCRIYDHHGFIGKPIREFKGSQYKGDRDLSPRFRRWLGSLLFFGGIVLTLIDWHAGFRLLWPAMLGTRMLIPGLLLLMTELIIAIYAWQKRSHIAATRP